MNVNTVLTRDYDRMDTWPIRKNEPKRTQNEPKFKKAKMNVNSYITKGYENKSNWAICENEPKSKPKQPQFLSAISVAGQTAYLLINRARPEFSNFLLKKPQIRRITYKAGACLCRFVYIRKPLLFCQGQGIIIGKG
jgi:hypothetical protein